MAVPCSPVGTARARGLPLPGALRRLLAELIIADRERRGSDFAHVTAWPTRIAGFEDLAFLFSSTILAHGIASLRFDEAAYLYRLVREERQSTIVEIGRFRGGSTFLLAAALESGSVHSYDIETRQRRDGGELDRQLIGALERYGLSGRVHLHIADSRVADLPAGQVDLLFIDGDHREPAVRADFERWSPLLPPGGHLLFHDAVESPDFASSVSSGPVHVVSEIASNFDRREAAGSLAHFARRS
jgi:predicted O-methyltransferase YrrM